MIGAAKRTSSIVPCWNKLKDKLAMQFVPPRNLKNRGLRKNRFEDLLLI